MSQEEVHTLSVQVVLFEEEVGLWVAQGLEYDIAAQGSNMANAERAFKRALIAQIVLDLRYGKEPLEDVARAPQAYWDRYETARYRADRQSFEVPNWVLPGYMIAAGEMRVYG